MAASPEKFQIMFVELKVKPKFILETNQKIIPHTGKIKLLGVTIYSLLKFYDHVKTLCQKANREVDAFTRGSLSEL